MPAPSAALTTLRPDLGSLMEFDLSSNMAGFIAYQVLPVIDVATAADSFGRIPTEQLGKIASVTRSSKGGYNRIDMTFTPDSYATKDYGLEAPVDERNARVYQNYLNAEVACAMLIRHMLLAAAEIRVAGKVFNTSTWTGSALTTNISTEWSTASSATPIVNVRAASQKVRDNMGQYANTLIINRKVFRNLQVCDEILDAIASQGAGDKIKASDVTADMIARCMDLEQVLVADSSYDNANEGQTTTFTDIWSSEYAMVCRLNTSPMIEVPTIGKTFHYTGDGSLINGLAEDYDEPQVRGKVLRIRHEVDEKIIYPECGHLLSNITA